MWSLIVLSLGEGMGLAMDAFAASICKGLSMKKLNIKHMIVIALYFGGFQALMPLIGWVLGNQFQVYIVSFDHWNRQTREQVGPQGAVPACHCNQHRCPGGRRNNGIFTGKSGIYRKYHRYHHIYYLCVRCICGKHVWYYIKKESIDCRWPDPYCNWNKDFAGTFRDLVVVRGNGAFSLRGFTFIKEDN